MPILLVLAALLLAAPAIAAEWTWAGPDGGSVNSLALQPGNPNVLYAGTATGVFKSVDGGATWRRPVQPFPDGRPANEIAVDPSNPAIVYAVFGVDLFKSTDGGGHWTEVGQAIRPVRRLRITADGVVYAGAGLGVFRSQDGGATWQGLNRGLPESRSVQALDVDPSRPQRMYAALDAGLYRTTNGGARWVAAGGQALSGASAVAVSPASPQTVYALAAGAMVRSFDGGATWSPGGGLPGGLVLAPHLSRPEIVYAGTGEGVFKSTDRGRTWARTGEELAGASVTALEIDPAGTLWAGVIASFRPGGVFRSTDGGAHWTFRSRGLSALVVEVLKADPHTPGTLFAGGRFGLARSRDRGLHWTFLPIPPGVMVADVEIDPVNPGVVYAAAFSQGLFLKSTDGGDSWTSLAGPAVLHSLAIDPVHPSVLYGAATNYGFSRSVDGGVTWVHKPMPLPPLTFLTEVEAAPGVLYAMGTVFDEPNPRVSRSQMFRSRNGGETWEPLDPSVRVFRLAVSPSDPETVYATGGTGIHRTTDGGDTWHQVSDLARVAFLAFAPGPPETLYAAVHEQGVFSSTDGGVTWTQVGEGLEGASLGPIAIDPHDPERLYVSVFNRGVAALFQPESCEAGPATLCLRGRFRVEAVWTDFQGNTGSGQAIPMTQETGGLWFFDPANVELVVKVLDGRGTNGRFWVFAASLTSVELTLTVTDIETGRQRVYYNPPGHMASFGDTEAF